MTSNLDRATKLRAQVTVTATDIRRGQRGGAQSCPIALAITRKLGTDQLFVDDTEVSITTLQHRWARGPLPVKVCEFIKAFDEKGRSAVNPLTFRLEVPFRD